MEIIFVLSLWQAAAWRLSFHADAMPRLSNERVFTWYRDALRPAWVRIGLHTFLFFFFCVYTRPSRVFDIFQITGFESTGHGYFPFSVWQIATSSGTNPQRSLKLSEMLFNILEIGGKKRKRQLNSSREWNAIKSIIPFSKQNKAMWILVCLKDLFAWLACVSSAHAPWPPEIPKSKKHKKSQQIRVKQPDETSGPRP